MKRERNDKMAMAEFKSRFEAMVEKALMQFETGMTWSYAPTRSGNHAVELKNRDGEILWSDQTDDHLEIPGLVDDLIYAINEHGGIADLEELVGILRDAA